MFFIFFISPLTLVKPLPVTERTQLLYKAHRCVHVHSRAPIHAVFDDTGNFFRFLVLHLPHPPPSRLATTNPISSATATRPLGFSSFTCPREGFSFPRYRLQTVYPLLFAISSSSTVPPIFLFNFSFSFCYSPSADSFEIS